MDPMIPTECACGFCGEWKAVKGWDVDLREFVCEECIVHVVAAQSVIRDAVQKGVK